VALLAGRLLTACGDDGTGPGSIFGTYTLITINGEELPVEIAPGFEITAGSVRLNSDNTYVLSFTLRLDGTTDTVDDPGTFTVVDGSIIQFTGGEAGNFSGTVSGNTLTIVEEGDTLVFRK
jgi:hypothetical protein